MKNIIILLILFGGLVRSDSPITIAPDVSFKSLDGKKKELYELLKDGPILLDFWATWCAPCKKEMIHLNRLHEKYKETGFKVVAMSTDSPRSMSKVKSYIRIKKYSFPVGLDPNQHIAKKFNATLIPTSILINKKGEIVWFHQGYIPGDEVEIEKQIMDVLKNRDMEEIPE